MSKNKVEVIIDNKSYTLSTVESKEYIQGISKYVDNKINELSNSSNIKKGVPSFNILLCLNIADDLFKQRQLFLKNSKKLDDLQNELNTIKSLSYSEKLDLEKYKDKINNLELEKKNSLKEMEKLNSKINDLELKEKTELKVLNEELDKLKQENYILKRSFDYFSENLNAKLENMDITNELSEIVSLHNKTIVKLARKLENLNSSNNL